MVRNFRVYLYLRELIHQGSPQVIDELLIANNEPQVKKYYEFQPGFAADLIPPRECHICPKMA